MSRRVLVALIAVVICAAAAAPRPADGSFPGFVTYRAVAGGGTIAITFTEDLTGVTRIALDGVTFSSAEPACSGTVSVVRYFDPPEPVTGGNFAALLVPAGLSTNDVDFVSVNGSVLNGSASGSASYGLAVAPEVGCTSDALPYVATGPVDTPPGPEDVPYSGAIEGASGGFALTLSADGDAVTSATFDELLMPCEEAVAINAAAFFEPPVPVDPATGEFTFVVAVHEPDVGSPIIRALFFSGVVDGKGGIAGTVDFNQVGVFCFLTDIPWSAQLASATPTPTASATPPPATPSPTSASAPVALPDTGSRSDGAATNEAVLALLAVMGLGFAVSGALRLRAD